MVKIVWRKKAKEQQKKILLFGERFYGRRMAKRLYDQIAGSMYLLAENPCMARLKPLLTERSTPYRSLVVHEHYELIYWVDQKTETLYVSDLWDTRREPLRPAKRASNK